MLVRSGLFVALAGLIMGGLAAISFLMDWNPYPVNHTGGDGLGFALLQIFVAILGVIVIVGGLILAVVGVLTNQSGNERR
jgi:hypothetical protein